MRLTANTPRGTIKSAHDRMILKYIQEHPGCTAQVISEFVRMQREHYLNGGLAAVPTHPEERLTWVRQRVRLLTEKHHVYTQIKGGTRSGEVRYFPMVMDGIFQGPSGVSADTSLVPSGRYDVMRCPVYKPPRPNVRPGGMDFARYPSLHNGTRQPFVPGR